MAREIITPKQSEQANKRASERTNQPSKQTINCRNVCIMQHLKTFDKHDFETINQTSNDDTELPFCYTLCYT